MEGIQEKILLHEWNRRWKIPRTGRTQKKPIEDFHDRKSVLNFHIVQDVIIPAHSNVRQVGPFLLSSLPLLQL